MLNRRQIRIKALQALYAHFQSGTDDYISTEKFLKQNMKKLYELYIYQLSLLIEIVDIAEERIEDGKNKYLPTEADLKPSTKFIDNRFIHKLRNNKDYIAQHENFKINWGGEREMLKKILADIRSQSFYTKYLENAEDNFEQDKNIIINIVRKVLINNDNLKDYFEEKYFLWSEDFYMTLSFVLTSLDEIDENWAVEAKLSPLYKNAYDTNGRNEDEDFLFNLCRKCIANVDKYDALIKARAINWEFDRIAAIDLVLMRMGMTEIFEFETIPLKLTLIEIIELAKHFSSAKSNILINGMLDKTIEEGLKIGTIVKKGRGLIGQK